MLNRLVDLRKISYSERILKELFQRFDFPALSPAVVMSPKRSNLRCNLFGLKTRRDKCRRRKKGIAKTDAGVFLPWLVIWSEKHMFSLGLGFPTRGFEQHSPHPACLLCRLAFALCRLSHIVILHEFCLWCIGKETEIVCVFL